MLLKVKKKNGDNRESAKIKRIFLWVMVIYALVTAAFYFLAGDQLRYRESSGTLELPVPDAGSIELSAGQVVEQIFTTKIDRLESVGVQFGAFYRVNAGTVTMDIRRLSDGEVLLWQSYDASLIGEGYVLTMAADVPIECTEDEPLVLRVTADSQPGQGVTPMVFSAAEPEEGFSLYINAGLTPGRLCFSAAGKDTIWMGQHYWEFVISFGALLAASLLIMWKRFASGKRSYLISALLAIKKYRFLIDQLVGRDFKTRYKRSVLGVLWSVLNPLLTMMVQYFVFSTIFKNDVPNFAVYLLIGVVMFGFFSESAGLTQTSILGNAGLITKVYMPKYIYPLTRTLSSLVNLLLSLIPLLVMCLATGVELKKSAILALYFMICLVIFTLGFGMLLATSMVFFRDTQFLWGVLSMMWMYATPVFYPERILPENLKFVLKINPIYYFIKNARVCILNGISPEPVEYLRCMGIALAMLLFGALVFRKNQNKFALYL